MTAERVVMLVKKRGLISENLAISTVRVLGKLSFQSVLSSIKWPMFLLVSDRHVDAHLDGHQ